MMSMSSLVCGLVACVAMVTAFHRGAREFSCADLIPGHGNSYPDLGYFLDHSTNVYGGKRLKIRIDGARDFRGFLIQSILPDGSYVGNFQRAPSTERRCENAGLTQTDGNVDKSSKTLYWRAPEVTEPLKVDFRARIVQNYTHNTLVTSNGVYVLPATTPAPRPARTTPKPRPPPTRKPPTRPSQPKQPRQNVADTKESSKPAPVDATSQRVADTLVQFSPNERREITKAEGDATGLSLSLDPTCGKSHGCFHDCVRGRCSFIVTWVDNGDHITFDLKKIEPDRSERWLAIGFSEDEHMGDDNVIECVIDKGFVYVYTSNNVGKKNTRMTDTKAGLTNAAGSYVDGVLECSFDRVKKDDFYKELNDLNEDWHLMFADGEAIDGKLFPHDYQVLPVVTPTKVDLQSFAIVGGEGPRFPLVVAHDWQDPVHVKSAAMNTGCDVMIVYLAVCVYIRIWHVNG